MSRLIAVSSLRNGLGRSTIASVLALKLSELGYKTLAIDNNLGYCDLDKILMAECEYSIDDIKPYLKAKSLDQNILDMLVTKVNDNLDLISGSRVMNVDNTLSAKNIKEIKKITNEKYDYIVIDLRARFDIKQNLDLIDETDTFVVVTVPNINNKEHYYNQIKNIPSEYKDRARNLMNNAHVVVNRYSDELNYDVNKELIQRLGSEKLYKIYFEPNIANFGNGFKCELESANEKEIHRLIKDFTKENNINVSKPSLTSKFKKLFNF